jgi:hypothetical protein
MKTNRIVGVMVTLVGFLLVGCHQTPPQDPTQILPIVPKEIAVAGPIVFRLNADGDQIYVWQSNAATKGAWQLKAPDAALTGEGGVRGRHYAGPTWECTTDDSKVAAKKIDEASSPDSKAIPWLLLQATKHEGAGAMSNITYIQRINTVGGKAPNAPGREGDEKRVHYTAVYVFYGPGATPHPIIK